MTDEPSDDDTIRAAAAAIAATLNQQLSDTHARSITLTRDEAIATLSCAEEDRRAQGGQGMTL